MVGFARQISPGLSSLSKRRWGHTQHFRQYSIFEGRSFAIVQNKPDATPVIHCHSFTPYYTRNYNQIRCFIASTINLKEYPPHILYPMPALSPTMENGTITSWNLKEGDEFIAGTSLCSIETDKASVDFEAQDDGILAKILRSGGNAIDIPVGTSICVVVDDRSDVAAFTDFVLEESTSNAAEKQATSSAADAPALSVSPPITTVSNGSASGPSGTSILLPSARHLAETKGLDATVLIGSAKGGRVTKSDVMEAIIAGTLPPLPVKSVIAAVTSSVKVSAHVEVGSPPISTSTKVTVTIPEIDANEFHDVANNKMRKIIASRLTESKRDVPHFYTSMEVELDNIMKLRKDLASLYDVKVSVNDFVIRCSALALRDVPEVNATYNTKTGSIQVQHSIDISVAVATPTGLITPIVFNTDRLGLSEISNVIKDLAGRARDGKLAPHEYQGGSFSVSNLGMFGIDEFSAVINPPQAAILAVGGGSKRVVATPYVDGASEQEKPSIKTIMTARLSADRRVVDEATASLFMSALRQYMNQPEFLLL